MQSALLGLRTLLLGVLPPGHSSCAETEPEETAEEADSVKVVMEGMVALKAKEIVG